MDPVLGPIVLTLLVLWFLMHRLGGRLTAAAKKHVATRATATTAAAAGAVGARSWQRRLLATVARIRRHSGPDVPKTAAGQDRQAQDSQTDYSQWRRWARMVWADAWAAGQAARARGKARPKRTRRQHGCHWWTVWTAWPAGDEPQAPKYVTSARDDRPRLQQPPIGLLPPPRALDPPPQPPPRRPPSLERPAPALTNGRTSPMLQIGSGNGRVAVANPGGVAAAESGLSNYINHSAGMGMQCEAAHRNTLLTLAALGNEDWSGVFKDTYIRAAESLKKAMEQFAEANAALIRCQDIRAAFNANPGAGDKPSILH